MIKVENDSFHQIQFGPKASETISQRRFLPKNKMIPISIQESVRRPYCQQTNRRKIQNWNITPVIIPFSILMYRSCNFFFYSQFNLKTELTFTNFKFGKLRIRVGKINHHKKILQKHRCQENIWTKFPPDTTYAAHLTTLPHQETDNNELLPIRGSG